MSVPQALRPPPAFISDSHAARMVGDRVGWPMGSELNTNARGELTICGPNRPHKGADDQGKEEGFGEGRGGGGG